MDDHELFQALFGKCRACTVSLMTLPDKRIRHYPASELARFHEDAKELGPAANTYFSVWPRRSDLPNGVRGGAEDIRYATCLFADYDVAGPAHKAPNLPPTKEAVLEHLTGLEKKPTVIVDPGTASTRSGSSGSPFCWRMKKQGTARRPF